MATDTGPGGRPAGSVAPAAPEREASRAGKLPSCCRLLQHLAARCRLLAPMPLDPNPLAVVIPTPMCSDPFRCTDWAYGSYVLYAVWRFRRARWMGSSHFGSPPVFRPPSRGLPLDDCSGDHLEEFLGVVGASLPAMLTSFAFVLRRIGRGIEEERCAVAFLSQPVEQHVPLARPLATTHVGDDRRVLGPTTFRTSRQWTAQA